MLKVRTIGVYGLPGAISGMRNPMNSWDKSDSDWKVMNEVDVEFGYEPNYEFVIGNNDLKLSNTLCNNTAEHRKFARMIHVQMDINAPLYWWKEFDTYKVGVTSNSCSTMHKIHANKFTLDDFSTEHLVGKSVAALQNVVDVLNFEREHYLVTKDKACWWQLIQLLPSSYNQLRTVDMTYENVFQIIRQRTGHKLDEWATLIEELNSLPYVKEFLKKV